VCVWGGGAYAAFDISAISPFINKRRDALIIKCLSLYPADRRSNKARDNRATLESEKSGRESQPSFYA
jgi:hypothetical protein